MRFSSLAGSPEPPLRAVGGLRGRSSAWIHCGLGMLLMVTMVMASALPARAQPPGTTPSTQAFDSGEDDIPIRGFLFLNEAKNRVIMPGLTWEEFERLKNLDRGVESTSGRYAFESLEAKGTVDGSRAELEITIRLTVDATDGRLVSIPLRMDNFHRVAPPDVSGVDEFYMTVAEDGSGYQFLVRCDERCDATVKMRVSARVQSSSSRSIEFRLPEVSSRVEIVTDDASDVGEVIGHGDETIESKPIGDQSTQLAIESSGGNFTLTWDKPRRLSERFDTFEVESRMAVQWDSPQDLPIAEVRLTVRNVKGSVDAIKLRLPEGAVVLDSPTLGTGGEAVDLNPVTEKQEGEDTATGTLYEVVVPSDERQPRIDLIFDMQLTGENLSPNSPLKLRVPEVIGAIRHKGELTIQTADDYRLRWRARPWIRSAAIELTEDNGSQRRYQFRFDRGSFELPIWLSANERQLRLSSQSTVTIQRAQALLDMVIEVSGPANDGRLRLDDASWQLLSVERIGTGEQLEYFSSEGIRIIELGGTGTETNFSIRVIAKLPMGQDLGDIEFPLPRVVTVGDEILIRDASLSLVGSGRSLMIVDLEASEGLTRLATDESSLSGEAVVSRFRLPNAESPAIVAGTLIDQPPRITLSAGLSVELDGTQAITTMDWEVSSPLDLGGSLPIRIPDADASDRGRFPSSGAASFGQSGRAGTRRDLSFGGSFGGVGNPSLLLDTGWTVTVDGVPAKLTPRNGDVYDLVSDRLGRGNMRLRWRHESDLEESNLGRARFGEASRATRPYSIVLPRPGIADVTIRGEIELQLLGSDTVQWVPFDFDRVVQADDRNASRMTLDVIPRDALRLRLQPRVSRRDERYVQRAVLRSAISTRTRHEQLLASIQGGDELEIGLPTLSKLNQTLEDITIEAFLDGQSINVNGRENRLFVSLPGDGEIHHLDLRVWVNSDNPQWVSSVAPMMKLPVGIGRVYWQLIAPSDRNVVWASPMVGRAMSWRFDDWRLFQEPVLSDQALTASPTSVPGAALPGNRYLYLGSDLPSFEVVLVSRTLMWLVVGAVILLISSVLTYWPLARHPLSGVVAAVAFAGLLIAAPDAAVLVGQFAMISLVLVVVMIGVRTLVSPASNARVFAGQTSSRDREMELQPTASALPPAGSGVAIAETQSLTPSSHQGLAGGGVPARGAVAAQGWTTSDGSAARDDSARDISGSESGSTRQSGTGAR